MYEPVKFKRLRELANDLNEKLDALQIGNLSAQELESMTEHSRELYERLVVLRYKAFDTTVKGEAAIPEVKEAEPIKTEPAPIAFKIDEPKIDVVPNQVSLIDAIEEVTKQETLDITESQQEEEAPPIMPAAEAPAEIAKNHITHNERAAAFATQESLHERLSKGMSNTATLAAKHENTAISDLKKAISLNQRFQFSKELFKGNNQEYEMAIDKLNTANREEAMKQLENLRSKFSWAHDNLVTQDFVSLVERRHQG
jgi:hypothetical protein